MASAAAGLPHIDEHAVEVEASLEESWRALLRVVEASTSGGAASRFARLLGCVDARQTGPRPLAAGSTVPGFRVEVAGAPSELALAGRHRFSDYALIFRLDERGDGGTRLRAETRAEFPGLKGSAYRAMVIGTRVHVLVTRRMLTAAKRIAERA